MDAFRLSVKSVHKTVGPRQFYGHIETLVDLGTSMDTEFQVSQNCQGPTVLWTYVVLYCIVLSCTVLYCTVLGGQGQVPAGDPHSVVDHSC